MQSELGQHCLSQRLLKHFSRREKQTTFIAIGALRVKNLKFFLKNLKYFKTVSLDDQIRHGISSESATRKYHALNVLIENRFGTMHNAMQIIPNKKRKAPRRTVQLS